MAASGVPGFIPNLEEVAFSPLDWAALVLFLGFGLGYHLFYAMWTRRHPLETVKGKIALYRRTWVKRILDRDEQILAVQSLRNLVMTSSFMASSALLVIAVVFNYLLSADVRDPTLSFKLLVLVGIYGYAFFSFLLSVRYLNHFTILVGADRDLIGSVEPVDAVTFLSTILNRAGNRFTMGQRAYYFSLPVMGWLVDTWVFLTLTLAVGLYLAVFLDFKKWRPPFPLRAAQVPEGGAAEEAAARSAASATAGTASGGGSASTGGSGSSGGSGGGASQASGAPQGSSGESTRQGGVRAGSGGAAERGPP